MPRTRQSQQIGGRPHRPGCQRRRGRGTDHGSSLVINCSYSFLHGFSGGGEKIENFDVNFRSKKAHPLSWTTEHLDATEDEFIRFQDIFFLTILFIVCFKINLDTIYLWVLLWKCLLVPECLQLHLVDDQPLRGARCPSHQSTNQH